jgi:DUF4097 and DUF4098 domain-containing protein YvlB
MRYQALMMVALAGLAAVPAFAQQGRVVEDGWCRDERSGNNREQACEVREYVLPAGAARLSVDGAPNGGIQVTGSARGDIVVHAKVTAWAESQQRAREILSAVIVDAASDKVSADGPRGLERRESWSASYRVAVPTQTSLELKTTNGGISIENVDGRIDFATVNGGVKLAAVAGEVHGRTSNGGVDVDLTGATWLGEGLDVETSNGGVRLRIPEQYSARLDAGTVNGGISVDFPVTLQGRIDREISTSLGAGGPLLRVRTHNGGVKVTKK